MALKTEVFNKNFENLKSQNLGFLGFYFLLKFYADHIKFQILIVICGIFYRKRYDTENGVKDVLPVWKFCVQSYLYIEIYKTIKNIKNLQKTKKTS